MARLFGWESVHNMNNVFYETWTEYGVDTLYATQDNVLRAASFSNNINMAPLFHMWGHQPSPSLNSELESLPLSNDILNLLLDYYDVIPETQADFLPFYNTLLDRKDPVHLPRLEEAFNQYDAENYAQQMRDQICNIIDLYYSEDCSAITSSIEIKVENDFIQILPNPTDGFFTVLGQAQSYNVEVLDEGGKVMDQLINQSSPIDIDISSLSAGIYFVRIQNTTNSKSIVQKIIKTQ